MKFLRTPFLQNTCGRLFLLLQRFDFPKLSSNHSKPDSSDNDELFSKNRNMKIRSSPPEVLLWKGVLKICNIFTEEHPSWSVISINLVKQLYWNHTSVWVLSCKFAAYFQNTFLRTPLEGSFWKNVYFAFLFWLPYCFIIYSKFLISNSWYTLSENDGNIKSTCFSVFPILLIFFVLIAILFL